VNFSFKRNFWVSLILIIAILSRIGFEFLLRLLGEEFIVTEFFALAFRYSTYSLTVLVFLSIIVKHEYSVSKLPWLLILIIEPFTGLFLFLTFGRDYRESNRYEKHPLAHEKRYLTREPKTDFSDAVYQSIDSEVTDIYKTAYNMTGHHAYSNDSSVDVLTNGDAFFPRLMEDIDAARHHIFLQFFIIRTDGTGRRIFEKLAQKASEGVEVRILYDALGSVFLNRKVLRELETSGVRIAAIDRIRFGFFDTRVNYRNHRKIVVIDGRIGFLGGMNLADEYWTKSRRFPPFRFEGSVVSSLTALFLRDWYYTTDQFDEDVRYYPEQRHEAQGLVQIIPSGPDFKYPPIHSVYVKLINNAKQSIKIMTPYLALDRELVTSLMIASRGGVDVTIIVPGKPDKRYIYEITRSFFEELLEEGISIYTMDDVFTHAKILIIDDTIASCGTYNLDNRSARINFEATALLYRQGVDSLVKDFNHDLAESSRVDLAKWRKRPFLKRVFEGVMGLFSPLV
jgi:cardiolipin synthase